MPPPRNSSGDREHEPHRSIPPTATSVTDSAPWAWRARDKITFAALDWRPDTSLKLICPG
ncbi:hypothetical protein [Nocardia sp. SC052]|uniref:hypothetical protein n=1 Tax=Nocardia sichangensis TaxID=3385975 RepID=UPI0039A02FBF